MYIKNAQNKIVVRKQNEYIESSELPHARIIFMIWKQENHDANIDLYKKELIINRFTLTCIKEIYILKEWNIKSEMKR